jgi:hypothetical protein
MNGNYFIWSPREYYHTHPEERYQKAKQGFEYIRDMLSKENVLLYWKLLSKKYIRRCEIQIREHFFL